MARTFTHSSFLILLVGGLFALLLIGAGCSRVGLYDVDDRENIILGEDMSAFVGLDGSLTEFAFDAVAEKFTASLLEEPVTENPNQGLFEGWMALQSDLPVNDSFENPIKLRSREARVYTLWTEGEDGTKGTGDDYFKTYRY